MAWRRDGGDLTGQRLFARQEFQDPQGLQGTQVSLRTETEVPCTSGVLKASQSAWCAR